MLRVVGKSLTQLLRDPEAGRMPGDVEMQNASAVMGNDKEAVQDSKGNGGNGKKSIAAMASRWLCRKAFQRCAGSGLFGARLTQRDSSPIRLLHA